MNRAATRPASNSGFAQYAIEAEDLAWLAERVAELQARVERSCGAYLATIAPLAR